MNEKEKELQETAPEFTKFPAHEGAATEVCTESKDVNVSETCSDSDACIVTESPSASIAEATADAPVNDEKSVEEEDKAEELEAAEGLEKQAAEAAKEGNLLEAETKMQQAEHLKAVAADNEDSSDERINYHTFSKRELVDALKTIVDNAETAAHKKVSAIKQSFYQLRNREIEAEMNEFVENGNAPETFTASLDETEVQLKDLLIKFRELRNEFLNAEEARRQENLSLKRRIIDQLRELADDIDNINLHFPKFQQLQADFKAINEIPAGEVADTWKSYQLAVEQFYDRLKMNKELRDLDFKKNLEYKRQLIDSAKALENEPDPIAAFRRLQDLHEKWRETGPVSKEMRESIWNEFKAISTVINKRHQDFFENRKMQEAANEEGKIKICEELEAIDFDKLKSFKDWEAETQHVLKLQADWKTFGFASRKVNNQLFNRFRKICDEFFLRKGAYFKSLKEEYAENMAKKVSLCEQAEAIRESETDVHKAVEKIARLQEDWRKVGPIARKSSDAIWERFNAVCKYVYDQRKSATAAIRQEENANLAAKRAILDALKAINIDEMERKQAIQQVRELQKQWNQTGHVPFKQKDALNTEYRQTRDTLFTALDMRNQKQRMSNFEEELANMDSDKAKLMRERERLSRAYEAKKNELNTAENNMGFFNIKSTAGSSMLRDMERRIKRLKEDLKLITQKISAVNQKLQ